MSILATVCLITLLITGVGVALFEAELPHTEDYANSHTALIILGAGLVLQALLAMHLQRQLLNRLFMGPIDDLIEGARRFGQGKLADPIQINRDDEIGQLAAAFNTMAAQVLSRENELKASQIELSTEIDERRVIEAALRESEAYYRLLAENARDVIWACDLSLNLTYVSPSAERMRGFTLKESQSQSISEILAPASANIFIRRLKEELASIRQGQVEDYRNKFISLELEVCRKDGSTFWTETTITTMTNHQGEPTGLLGVTRDIHKRKETEERLHVAYEMMEQRVEERTAQLSVAKRKLEAELAERQQADALLQERSEALQRKTYQQEQLIEVARQLTASLDVHVVLRRIAQGAKDIAHAYGCVIYMLDDNKHTLIPVVAIDPLYEEEMLQSTVEIDECLNGQVIKARRGMIFNDPLGANKGYQIPGTSVDVTERLIAAPLIVDDEVLGSLCINRMQDIFTEEDLALTETFAAYASTALRNAQSHFNLLREVEERRNAEEALRVSEERYMLASLGANDGLWDWDLRANQIYLSPRWKAMLGYSDREIDSRPDEWFGRVHPDDLEAVQFSLSRHLQGLTPHFECEYRMRHKDNTYRWILTRGLAVRAPDISSDEPSFTPYRLAGSQTDITARKKAEEQLIHDALHDALTRLPNRSLFLDRLGRAIERLNRRPESPFAVLFLDLDRFKVINDSLGHTAGDQMLIAIAERLSLCLRSSDTAARLGGDEFVVLLEEIQGIHDAIAVTDRINKSLKSPFDLDGHKVVVTASIGIVLGAATLSAVSYRQAEEVLRDADIAMYRAKALGKNRFVVFDPALRTRAIARLECEYELRMALERGEFKLHYQPICSLANDQITGFEALLRWYSPTRGIVPPGEFIPVAEETGLIIPIGEWVLREACHQILAWQKEFPSEPPLTINVNISGVQFANPALLDQITGVLNETSLAPALLRLEITESVFMENAESATFVLQTLRQMGVHLQIDDFGTGYSSLSYLQNFPINAIKIDRSFISRMDRNNPDASNGSEIVKTIVALAHDLGVEAVAEGVETLDQLEQLKALECQYGQGFYLGRPMEASAAEAKLIVRDVKLAL